MLRRCYHPNELKRNPTYIDCVVSEDFLRFSNFLKFVKSMKEYGLRDDNGRSYCLDKDILSTDKKIYDENTICLIPQEINKFFQNRQADRGKFSAGVYYDKDRSKFCARVTYKGKTKFLGRFCTEYDAWCSYKEYKKQVAIELAEKWHGRVDKRVYETLINYNADDWV